MTIVHILVEGRTDAPVARRLLEHVGLEVGIIYGLKGKADLLKRLPNYNAAARHWPWFVIVDLDSDAACVRQCIDAWLPNLEAGLRLRVAVRSIEAWLLADIKGISRYLGIASSRLAYNPDLDPHPKQTLVNLARSGRNKSICQDMIPVPGSNVAVGLRYADRLIEFVENHWQPDEAAERSESLRRCIQALSTLTSWQPTEA